MVKRSQVSASIDRKLSYSHAILDELYERVNEWNEMSQEEWSTWSMDWDQFARTMMRELNELAADGRMSTHQQVEYRRLIQRLVDDSALIDRYGLAAPRIPVTT